MADIDEEKKKEIAVIGSEEFRLGFRLAGVKKTYSSESFEEQIMELLQNPELGIVVTEESEIQEASKKVQNHVEASVDPVVIGLSEEAESERLQEKIKKAIGADIT